VDVQDDVEYYERELNKLYNSLAYTYQDNISFEDLSECIVGNEPFKEMQSLADYLHNRVFIKPFSYDFYFRVGSLYHFKTCHEIGRGSVCEFKDLPPEIKGVYRLRMNTSEILDIEEIEKRHQNKRFLHFKVESIGPHKALEKAIEELKTSISILKLTYNLQISNFLDYTFSYHVIDSKHRTVVTYQDTGIERNQIDKPPWLDNKISNLTNITEKNNRTELENRIVNAINIFGMIKENTQLEIRFLLCIISLEGLLHGKDDKDYLGSRLADKMAFLLGDLPEWLTKNRNLLPESRREMAALTLRLYGKRSALAHTGKGKEIEAADFNDASMILRLAIEKLTELAKLDYIQLAKEEKKRSIDGFIEDLKYGVTGQSTE
jgi:hypothetical protein